MPNFTNKDFKTPNGGFILGGLFFELDQRLPKKAIYTTKDDDLTHEGVTYVSLKKLYLEYKHCPGSEYDFANEHLGGWRHWLRLMRSPTTKEMVLDWQAELEVKLRAAAVKEVILKSKGDKGYQAAKWIAEGGYTPKKAGRPSKDEVARQAAIERELDNEVNDMIDRIQ